VQFDELWTTEEPDLLPVVEDWVALAQEADLAGNHASAQTYALLGIERQLRRLADRRLR
jgi:hypothetical protein